MHELSGLRQNPSKEGLPSYKLYHCYAGEPELAVAVHCIRRPIIVYKQVRACCPSVNFTRLLCTCHV